MAEDKRDTGDCPHKQTPLLLTTQVFVQLLFSAFVQLLNRLDQILILQHVCASRNREAWISKHASEIGLD